MNIGHSYLIAFFATLCAIWILTPIATKVGFVDRPGGRKQHGSNIPLIGGIAIFFGFYLSLLFSPIPLQAYRPLFAASIILLLVGVADDIADLKPRIRLVTQIAAAAFATYGSQQPISFVGNLFGFGSIYLSSYGGLLELFIFISYFNAMNMLDGQDGLAGLVSVSQLILLIYMCMMTNNRHEANILAIFMVTLLVYLAFNLNIIGDAKSKIFLGDAGSTFIALIIIYFCVRLSQISYPIFQPMAFAWVAAYPIFDLVSVFVYRVRCKKSPFTAGRDHMHHIIEKAALKPIVAVILIVACSVLLGIFGLILNAIQIAEYISFILYIICLVLYVISANILRNKIGDH